MPVICVALFIPFTSMSWGILSNARSIDVTIMTAYSSYSLTNHLGRALGLGGMLTYIYSHGVKTIAAVSSVQNMR